MNYTLSRIDEDIKSVGGLGLIGRALARIKFTEAFSSRKTAAILKTEIALLCQGRTDFNDVELFRDDDFFAEALDIPRVPSEPTLRQRLNACGSTVHAAIRRTNLAALQLASLTPEKVGQQTYIPVDIDVSPFDNSGSKKEGVSYTYKKVDGYAPIFAYIGREGHLLNCELRPGSQHSQKDAPEFLRRCVADARQLGVLAECLFRLDSAHDAAINLDILSGAGCKFLIKRNLRQESRIQWADRARATGEPVEPRPGKRVWRGIVSHLQPARGKSEEGVADLPLFVVYEVTERTIDAKGRPLLFPEVQVDTWPLMKSSPWRRRSPLPPEPSSATRHCLPVVELDLPLRRRPCWQHGRRLDWLAEVPKFHSTCRRSVIPRRMLLAGLTRQSSHNPYAQSDVNSFITRNRGRLSS